jgi:hypothetical protein
VFRARSTRRWHAGAVGLVQDCELDNWAVEGGVPGWREHAPAALRGGAGTRPGHPDVTSASLLGRQWVRTAHQRISTLYTDTRTPALAAHAVHRLDSRQKAFPPPQPLSVAATRLVALLQYSTTGTVRQHAAQPPVP